MGITALGPLKVLVVDDNRDVADSLGAVLQVEGYAVQKAYGGEEALELAARGMAEVVLMDIQMPGLSGYDVARKLHRRTPRPVVIALTAYSQHSDKVAAKQAGFDHFLTKPVEFEMLFGLLSMVAQSLHRPDPA